MTCLLAPPLLALVLSTSSEPTRFAWPLPIHDGLASSFGESRGDRLHTGVDLRTRMEVGWPVLAAADGTVYRLKDTWRGYGRAVYVRHDDGFISVYGHLDRFEDAVLGLESRVLEARGSSRHAGNIYLDPTARVKRGQVIGFSGESGNGLPHLHFEVRLGEDVPVDPFRHGLEAPRGPPPLLGRLHIIPAGPEALVNGLHAPAAVTLQGSGAGSPVIAGPVRLVLEAEVPGGGTNKLGLSALEAVLGQTTLLRFEPERIPYTLNYRAGTVFDLARTRSRPTVYAYRLDALASDLERQAGLPPPLQLEPGPHQLTLRARGPAGETTRASLTLVGAESGPQVVRPEPPAAARFLEPEPWPEGLLVRVLAPARPPEPRELQPLDTDEPPQPLRPGPEAGQLQALLTPARPAGVLRLRLGPGSDEGALRVPYGWASSEKGLSLADPPFSLEAPAGAVYASTLVTLSAPEHADVAPPPPGLRLLAGPFVVRPDGLPLRSPATLSVAVASARAGIYGYDPWKREYGYIRSRTTAGGVSTRVRRTGIYAALRDDSAPRLRPSVPVPGGTLPAGTPVRLAVLVDELGMGLAEDGVEVRLDGKALRASFDPDRDRSSLERPLELTPGPHVVEFRAVDRAGNRARPLVVAFEAR